MFWKSKKAKADDQAKLTPAEDIQVAWQAFNRGDARHAIQHLAWTLSVEPQNPEALALLDQVIKSSSTPFDLVAWENPPTPYPIAAVRAYIHSRQNELDEALAVMTQIYKAVPGLPFLPWVVDWAKRREQLSKVKPDTITFLLSSLNAKISPQLEPTTIQFLEALLPEFSYYQKNQPPNSNLTFMLSISHRKLGKVDEALSLAQLAYQATPGYFSATVLGGAYREKGMVAEAVAAFRQALSFQPEDIAIRLDIGDTLCGNGQIEEGLLAYQEVLEREPEHQWAYPSSLYYLGILEPEGSWKAQLEEFAKKHPANERAANLVRQQLPFLGSLPEPSDATVNLARQIMEKGPFPSSLSMGLSSLEAPSAFRALQLIQLELYGKADLKLEAAQIQRPDPRVPRGQVDFVLWRYNGTTPEPNLPPPSQEVSALVGELANIPYEADSWWLKAGKYAGQLNLSNLNDLLGVMLYPPARPAQTPLWVWLYKVQLAASFIIARLEKTWEGSLRRSTLVSLVRGPMDWTVGAAIVTLCQLVRKENLGKPEIEALFLDLFQNMPRPGGVPYDYALICCSLYINPTSQLAKVAREALHMKG